MFSTLRKFIASALGISTPLPYSSIFPPQEKKVTLYKADLLHELTISNDNNLRLLGSYQVGKLTHYKVMDKNPRHEFLVAEIVERGSASYKPAILLRIERLRDRTNDLQAVETVGQSSDPRQKAVKEMLFPSNENQLEFKLPANQDLGQRILPTASPSDNESVIPRIPTLPQPTLEAVLPSSISGPISDANSSSNAKDVLFRIGQLPTLGKRRHLILQSFAPENLSLVNLAILAEAVHDIDPIYSLFNHQCYWYADTIMRVIQALGGDDITRDIKTSNRIEDSKEVEVRLCLTKPKEAGYWRSFPIHLVRDYVVGNAQKTYDALREEHEARMEQVRVEDERKEAERDAAIAMERKKNEKLKEDLAKMDDELKDLAKQNDTLKNKVAENKRRAQEAGLSDRKV